MPLGDLVGLYAHVARVREESRRGERSRKANDHKITIFYCSASSWRSCVCDNKPIERKKERKKKFIPLNVDDGNDKTLFSNLPNERFLGQTPTRLVQTNKTKNHAAVIESCEKSSPFYKFVSRKHSVNFSVNEPAAL